LAPGGSMKMSIRRFEIERFSVTSSRPFEAVVAALKDAVGRQTLPCDYFSFARHPGAICCLNG
jgi:hypothetical protein